MDTLDIKSNIIAVKEVQSQNKKCQTKVSEFYLYLVMNISNDLDPESTPRVIVIYI